MKVYDEALLKGSVQYFIEILVKIHRSSKHLLITPHFVTLIFVIFSPDEIKSATFLPAAILLASCMVIICACLQPPDGEFMYVFYNP